MRISLTAIAPAPAALPAPAPAPATIIINGFAVASIMTSRPALTTDSSPTEACTIFRIKLIDKEPPTANLPAPAPPIVTLIIEASPLALTTTSPLLEVTEEPLIYARTWPALLPSSVAVPSVLKSGTSLDGSAGVPPI